MTTPAFGLSTVNGLPAHILIVHMVVVFVPLSAVLLVASMRTSVAHGLGKWLPITAALALVSVFAAMNAGGWLEDRVASTALLRRHTELGGQLWPFSLAVLLLSLFVWWNTRGPAEAEAPAGARDAGGMKRIVAVGVLAVVAATLSIVQVVRIGDSGSRAAWHGQVSSVATHHDGD
ncbi:MAG TPA: DUF2231 domain-containing protein [Mycobacteriales bacterium]|nr:DUF2231 domain-containing protein [Mycobacteriales bacterium]